MTTPCPSCPPTPPRPEELELRDQLEASFITTASIVPDLQPVAVERSARVVENAVKGPTTQGQRLLLAQAAIHATTTGESAHNAIELAERAWDGGRILANANPQWIGWRTGGRRVPVERRARELAASSPMRRWPTRAGARGRSAFATASYVRGLPLLWQGRVDRRARRPGACPRRPPLRLARVRPLAPPRTTRSCLIERDELDQAQAVLDEDGPLGEPQDIEDVLRLYSLAELRLAQRRAGEALEAALTVGEIGERTVRYLGYCPWRTTAAQAALMLGRRRPRARVGPRGTGPRRADRRAAHADPRPTRPRPVPSRAARGCAPCATAVRLGSDAPPRLETIRALVDLGAALRRENRRSRGARIGSSGRADLAANGGAARALSERARIELAAAGARPRRDALLSGPASLTPSERRIAELAATGQCNREIAQALFVTPKTVEYHLRNAYRKLDIQTRRELPTP